MSSPADTIELERQFATFGEEVTIDQVADLVQAGRTVWSWGYGDSETEFTTLDEEDLWFVIESPEDADIAWGPFRVGPELCKYESGIAGTLLCTKLLGHEGDHDTPSYIS